MYMPSFLAIYSLVYLAVQSMIAIIAVEVGIRYYLWWRRIRYVKKLFLRPVVLSLAVLAFAQYLTEGGWAYWRIAHSNHTEFFLRGFSLINAYFMVSHVLTLGGLLGALVPLWRRDNVSSDGIILRIVSRLMVSAFIYFLVLRYAEVSPCLFAFDCR